MSVIHKLFLVASIGLSGVAITADDAVLDGSDVKGIEGIVATAGSDKGWRKAAHERIEAHRMANLTVMVVDHKGKPVKDAPVYINQTRQAFNFGVVIKAEMLDQIKTFVPKFGNQIGFNNALKFKHRKNLAVHAEKAIKWARSEGLGVRGHVLMWPGRSKLHKDAVKLMDDGNLDKLKAYADAQVISYAARWDVDAWDVVNETINNHDLQDILGQQELVHWFLLARRHARNPDIPLYLNENRIVSAIPGQKDRMAPFKRDVEYLLENGAPITHLGLQSRYRTDAIPPEEMLRRLDELAQYGLPITATEFEIANGRGKSSFRPDAHEKARLAEEVMTVYFSHPSVDGIVFWTLVSHTAEEKGLLNPDMSLTPLGKLWLHMVNDRWRTEELMETGKNGQVSLRAYKGGYSVMVEHKGKVYSAEATLGEDGQVVRIRLK